MLCLCAWALLSLASLTFLDISVGTSAILIYADYVLCGIFFLDFLRNLYRAPNRVRYLLGWGWIDLLSSIPTVGALRWGRAARVLRILRVLRALRSAQMISQFAVTKRAESAFMVVMLLTLLIVVSASIAILQFEPAGGGNITSPEDALWWAIATMTTVGYGDVYPVTPEGRLLAVFLMVAGVGWFGTLSGLVASWFLSPGEKEQGAHLEDIRETLRALRSALPPQPSS
jgi:voltage-gated potassium channel